MKKGTNLTPEIFVSVADLELVWVH